MRSFLLVLPFLVVGCWGLPEIKALQSRVDSWESIVEAREFRIVELQDSLANLVDREQIESVRRQIAVHEQNLLLAQQEQKTAITELTRVKREVFARSVDKTAEIGEGILSTAAPWLAGFAPGLVGVLQSLLGGIRSVAGRKEGT